MGIWCLSKLHRGIQHPLQTLGIWCPSELGRHSAGHALVAIRRQAAKKNWDKSYTRLFFIYIDIRKSILFEVLLLCNNVIALKDIINNLRVLNGME